MKKTATKPTKPPTKRGPKIGEHGYKVTYSIRVTSQVREFLRENKPGKSGDFVDDEIRKTADFQAFSKNRKNNSES